MYGGPGPCGPLEGVGPSWVGGFGLLGLCTGSRGNGCPAWMWGGPGSLLDPWKGLALLG